MGDGSGCEAKAAAWETYPRPREALPRPPPPGLPGTHLSGETAVRATSLRAASAACGTVHVARERGGDQGSRGARDEEVSVRRGQGGAARRRQGADRAAGVGEGRKAGEGGGRERGRKQCSRLGPGRVPLPNAATRVDFGASVPPPEAGSGAAGLPALPAAEAPAATGWLGRRNSRPVTGSDGGAAGRTPRWDPAPAGPPGTARGGAGAGGRRRARRRRPNAAGPGLGREEARRPGRRKRGPDPPPAAARLREGARRTCGGAWAGGAGAGGRRPLPGAGGAAGGVSPTPGLPLPAE